MRRRFRRRSVWALVFGTAAVAVAAPTAQARFADNQFSPLSTTPSSVAYSSPYEHTIALRNTAFNALETSSLSADDRAGIRGPGTRYVAPIASTSPSNGFDWTDAGIGAGTALAALLASGLLVGARRTRRDQLAV